MSVGLLLTTSGQGHPCDCIAHPWPPYILVLCPVSYRAPRLSVGVNSSGAEPSSATARISRGRVPGSPGLVTSFTCTLFSSTASTAVPTLMGGALWPPTRPWSRSLICATADILAPGRRAQLRGGRRRGGLRGAVRGRGRCAARGRRGVAVGSAARQEGRIAGPATP